MAKTQITATWPQTRDIYETSRHFFSLSDNRHAQDQLKWILQVVISSDDFGQLSSIDRANFYFFITELGHFLNDLDHHLQRL